MLVMYADAGIGHIANGFKQLCNADHEFKFATQTACEVNHDINTASLSCSLVPRFSVQGEEGMVSTVHACAAPRGFSGNMDRLL